MITCNVTTITKMIRIALPKMANDPLPQPGVSRFIINMGSYSGLMPAPYLAVYSACKSYTHFLTECLAAELKDTCVKVQLFAPSFISTNMSGIKRSSRAVPTATTYAKSALSMLGVETVGCGYFHHAFQLQITRLIPSCLLSSIIAKKMIVGREKWLRRQKAKAQ